MVKLRLIHSGGRTEISLVFVPQSNSLHAFIEMTAFLPQYPVRDVLLIGLSVLLYSMGKGGFPVGTVALPLLVLVWPGQDDPAKTAVAFMLPMLCIMDLIGIIFYKRDIDWKHLLPLFPGTLAGVAVAAMLFLTRSPHVLQVSDKGLKLCIGILGLGFVFYQAAQKWIHGRVLQARPAGWLKGSLYGLAAGITSTIAHAAIPVMQMYLLPLNLSKLSFAGTTVAYFLILNQIKLIPFTAFNRIEPEHLILGAWLLPVIPVGVILGYFLVKVMKPSHYMAFIYATLFLTSAFLICKAVAA